MWRATHRQSAEQGAWTHSGTTATAFISRTGPGLGQEHDFKSWSRRDLTRDPLVVI
jgi:hypothetical protein